MEDPSAAPQPNEANWAAATGAVTWRLGASPRIDDVSVVALSSRRCHGYGARSLVTVIE